MKLHKGDRFQHISDGDVWEVVETEPQTLSICVDAGKSMYSKGETHGWNPNAVIWVKLPNKSNSFNTLYDKLNESQD